MDAKNVLCFRIYNRGVKNSEKTTNDSQHLEQCEQQTDDQDAERASIDNIKNSSVVAMSTPESIANLQSVKNGRKRSLNTCVLGVNDAIKQLKQISKKIYAGSERIRCLL